MLEGSATRGFDGTLVGDQFQKISSHARVTGFSIDKIAALGIQPSALRDTGGSLEDGSVILTDLPSLESGQPQAVFRER